VTVTDSQVDGELDKRMRYYIKIFKTEHELEEYFHTSVIEMKAELRESIRDQMVVQQMQSKITKDITASPSEVKAYFKNIPRDSLPYINAEIQVAQIVKTPPVSEEELKRIKEQLEEYKRKLLMAWTSPFWQPYILKMPLRRKKAVTWVCSIVARWFLSSKRQRLILSRPEKCLL